MPGVVVTLRSPFGRSRLSVSLARAASSFMNTSWAVLCRSSPCSVRISPRAWRWKSETPSSCSSAETCRETADCDSPSCSPACVKLPASAAAWKTFSLSQSMLICARPLLRRYRRLSLALQGEKALGLERRHAALAGSGYGLSIDVVGHVAGREDARHRGRRRERRGLDVARGLHVQLPCEQLGSGGMADGDEYAVRRALAARAGFDVAQNDAFHLQWVLLAQNLFEHGVPDHGNFRILEQTVLQNLFGAERIAPVHDRDARSEIGEEQRLLDRGIAAADHQHVIAPIEEAIAGGASGYAIALEFLLGRQVEPARLGTGRNNHAVGEVVIAGIAIDSERAPAEIGSAHMVGNELGPDMLGLPLHLLHQPGALDDVGEAGIILDIGGDGELSAGLDALDQNRLQHGAGGIDRSRIAGSARTDDDELGSVSLAHRRGTPVLRLSRNPCQSRCRPNALRVPPLASRGSGRR